MSDKRVGQKIKLLSVDELLGVPNSEGCVDIEISKIHPFKDHPFKVVDDDKMKELIGSISENGVLTPVIVRPVEGGDYEMISGHRRLYAAEKAGIDKLPVMIRDMTDDQAVITMVDANLQREEILPSEKAHAYKMRYEAMKRQGHRSDLTSSQSGKKSKADTSSQGGRKLWADEMLAAEVGESRNQIHRFLRLAELSPELLDLIDKKRIAIMTGVDMSYLSDKIQRWIFEYITEKGVVKSYQVIALRNYLNENDSPTKEQVYKALDINTPNRLPSHRVAFSGKTLKKFFPAYYTAEEMEQVIISLLTKWKDENATASVKPDVE